MPINRYGTTKEAFLAEFIDSVHSSMANIPFAFIQSDNAYFQLSHKKYK